MKVLFLCIPGGGRFQLLAPLASEFRSLGHQVRFVAPENFAPVVAAFGFDALLAGVGISALEKTLRAEAGRAFDKDPSERAVQMFTRIYPQFLLPDLLPKLSSWTPDLVVHEEGEFAAPLLATILGVRCVTVGWPVALKPLHVIDAVTRNLEPLWERWKYAPKRFAGLYETFLDTCPPSLQSSHATAIPSRRPMRPNLLGGSATPDDQNFMSSLRRENTIHITFGTVGFCNNAPDLLSRIIDGLADEPITIVLTTGEGTQFEAAGKYQNLRLRPYLPHKALLPRCAAVICHGGAGTTIAALIHGIPLLLIPRGGASQHRNAFQCARFGAAICADEATITPLAAKQAVRKLLRDPKYRFASRLLEAEIHAMPDMKDVAISLQN